MVEAEPMTLQEILNEKQIDHIISQSIGENVPWALKDCKVKPVMEDGMSGFLGDHSKALLRVEVQGVMKDVHLFLKRVPVHNKPKAAFIDDNNFFRREKLMYKVLEETDEPELKDWCVIPYIYTDSIIVMPDLSIQGYKIPPYLHALDHEHIFLAIKSIARFHAAFVNYESKKTIDVKRPYNIYQEFPDILKEPGFYDSPFVRSSSKLSKNLLSIFSSKDYGIIDESKLATLHIAACDTLIEYKETVNVLLHRDLWANNIMFKYKNHVPTAAVLIDYQCLRYGPPAFDVMIFLYLTTDRNFREQHENDVFGVYYLEFVKNLTDSSKNRLKDLGYNKDSFVNWCEKARMFGIFEAISLYPFILMDPKTSQRVFNDPETFEKHVNGDRTEPVVTYAETNEIYRRRNLEVSEEFMERYVLGPSQIQ